jgi:hypothetical protein
VTILLGYDLIAAPISFHQLRNRGVVQNLIGHGMLQRKSRPEGRPDEVSW